VASGQVVVRNGMFGVDLFFLITGFLLVLPWLRTPRRDRAAVDADFYRRRVRASCPPITCTCCPLLRAVPLLRGLEFWRYNPAYCSATCRRTSSWSTTSRRSPAHRWA
jgi:peptidoglycan/LPS O-acetylase OafA/YrhL